MESFVLKYRNALTLTLLIVVQMLGLAFQVKRTTEEGVQSNMLHAWAVRMIAPIEKAFVHSERSVSHLWANYIYLRGLRSENSDLKQQLDLMRVQNARLQEDARQARRIQVLLGFKEQFIHRTLAAQVIGTSGSDLSRVIYIDKGTDDGVRSDMAVITPDGIVGKILRAQRTTSQVLEISDQTSGVGALLVKSRLQGIVKGTPGGDIVLNNIMSDEKVEVGDPITTSGGDRIFPKGIPIGNVSGVFPGKDVFLNIRLKPAANLNKLEEVLVVTEIATQQPETTDLGPIRASDILAARLPSVPQSSAPPDANQTPPPPNAPNASTQKPGAQTAAPKTTQQPPTVKPQQGTATTPNPAVPKTVVPKNPPKKEGAANPSADQAAKPKSEAPKKDQPPTSTTPPPQGPRP